MANKLINAFPVRLRPDDVVERKMVKKGILERAVKEERPPERKIGWLCSYCSLGAQCPV